MPGIRDGMLMVGERMMLCARSSELARKANGRNARINPLNLRRIFICRLGIRVDEEFSRIFGKARDLRFGAKPTIEHEPLPQGVATARLTIFSFCSLFKRPAISSLLIARLPNCSLNMPPFP